MTTVNGSRGAIVSGADMLTPEQWAAVLPSGDIVRRHPWVQTPVFRDSAITARERARAAILERMRTRAEMRQPDGSPAPITPIESGISTRRLTQLRDAWRNGGRS